MIQINVSQTYLYRLPMPQPGDEEIRSNPDYAQLAKNALLLSLAASWDDFAEFAPLFAVDRNDPPLTATAQDGLRAQNDRLVAKLYGLTTGDLMRLNGVSNANMIWIGQVLRITARVDAVDAATANAPKAEAADEIYVVQAGDTLADIAARHQTTVQILLTANGLPNPNFVWVGQRLRVRANDQPESTLSLVAAPADGKRWIEVDLTNQTLTAWQGDVPVMFTAISSGRAGTPTVTGRFTVGTKYKVARMTGPGYDIPDVPWVMYFHQGYALHGAYWHNNFGVPMSHGCVNLRPGEAEMLYNWAPAGTEVYVHY